TKIGALIGKEHYDRVNSYLELAKQDGGKFDLGGNRPEGIEGGYFIEPTIITNLPDQCRVQQEEVFGPVVAITPFDSEDEVIAAANGTPYGLSASVWSNDIKQAHRVAQQIEAGTVWVNSWFVRDFRASQ